IIGVAIDERDKVKAFADEMLVNYPMLVGDQDAVQVAKRYGNHLGALPYSVIVDRDGEITFVRRGELEKAVAEREIRALL
nr:peroxiredoxin family protein [Gammaproteobacteria bacterium]